MSPLRSPFLSYYRNADGCLIVFDLTQRESFEKVSKWAEHARQYSNNPHLVFTLVGNKADQAALRQVAREEAEAVAAHQGMECKDASGQRSPASVLPLVLFPPLPLRIPGPAFPLPEEPALCLTASPSHIPLPLPPSLP